jgi:hypothetical protein
MLIAYHPTDVKEPVFIYRALIAVAPIVGAGTNSVHTANAVFLTTAQQGPYNEVFL